MTIIVPEQFKGHHFSNPDLLFTVVEKKERGVIVVRCDACDPRWLNRGKGYLSLEIGGLYELVFQEGDRWSPEHKWIFMTGLLPWFVFGSDGVIVSI